jgi:hypothetical protein
MADEPQWTSDGGHPAPEPRKVWWKRAVDWVFRLPAKKLGRGIGGGQ